jgi:hypothetical protein
VLVLENTWRRVDRQGDLFTESPTHLSI